jgi:hypothetical protein
MVNTRNRNWDKSNQESFRSIKSFGPGGCDEGGGGDASYHVAWWQIKPLRGRHDNRRDNLKGHPFFTILVRTGSRSLWQSQAHFSLAQAWCLLFLHDQLMPDP